MSEFGKQPAALAQNPLSAIQKLIDCTSTIANEKTQVDPMFEQIISMNKHEAQKLGVRAAQDQLGISPQHDASLDDAVAFNVPVHLGTCLAFAPLPPCLGVELSSNEEGGFNRVAISFLKAPVVWVYNKGVWQPAPPPRGKVFHPADQA